MKVGVIVAMDKEYDCIVRFLDVLSGNGGEETFCEARKKCVVERQRKIATRRFVEGKIKGNEIILVKSAIGKVNAAISTTLLIQNFSPDIIISTGVAGGASNSLKIGDVVVGEKIYYHDVYCNDVLLSDSDKKIFCDESKGEGERGGEVQDGAWESFPIWFSSDKKLVDMLQEAVPNIIFHKGLIASGDRFVDRKEAMMNILNVFPEALAVDMESAAIAQTCYSFNIPFVSFRIISDIPLIENSIQEYKNFWGKMAERSFNVIKTALYNIC